MELRKKRQSSAHRYQHQIRRQAGPKQPAQLPPTLESKAPLFDRNFASDAPNPTGFANEWLFGISERGKSTRLEVEELRSQLTKGIGEDMHAMVMVPGSNITFRGSKNRIKILGVLLLSLENMYFQYPPAMSF